MSQVKIAVIVGSLRKESFNRKLALAIEGLLPAGFTPARVEIGELPLYNQDFDGDYPASGTRFKQQVEAADAVLFVTPEYNRSVPGVLKNAIDLGSRPYRANSFDGKPAAIVGTSPGAAGSALSQQHLRNVLVGVNMVVMPQPEVFIQFKEGLIGDHGDIGNDGTRKFLQGFVDRYAEWVTKTLAE